MKKTALVLALLLVAGIAFGQKLYFASAPTLRWDDPGISDPAQTVTWEVWRSTAPVADRANPEEFILATTIAELALTIPADDQAHAYAVRMRVVEGAFNEVSRLVWIDLEGSPGPFLYAESPPAPSGLRTVVVP